MKPSLEEQLAASIELAAARKAAEEVGDLSPLDVAKISSPKLVVMPAPAPRAEVPELLSPSSINCFLDCSARWYYRKVLKLEETRGAALGLGTAVHTAIMHNFEQKIESGKDLSVRDTQARFIHALCDELDSGLKLLRGETDDDLKAAGDAMVRLYMERSAPRVDPAAIEEHVEGTIGGVRVHGYIDVRTRDGRVIDIKTSARRPSGITPAQRMQLSTYVMLHPQASGEATIVTMTKTKTVALVEDSVTILPPERKLTEKLYSITLDQMQTGLVAPNRASFLCGKYCSFRGRCVEDYGGTIPEVE